MGVHFAGNVPHVVGALERHVAIGALLRLRRVVERARALSGDAAGLPVVVLVEAANPAVVIDRHVEVHLVARRTELRRLLLHERLEEHTAVRLRIQLDHEVVQLAHERIFAGRELVQFRILKIEITLAHRAFYVGDGVAHHAAESGLGFGRVHDLFDGRIHLAGIEHRRVMASAAPF